jgi:gamma-glutamyltranspeptidase
MMPATRRASGGMVTAPHVLAAESGARILADGGTAIEAALATAATLAVVYPHMTGLGGDSFWLVAEPGCVPRTIDGAGRAGSRVSAIQSLYFEFGAGIGLTQSGFVWQNRGCGSVVEHHAKGVI